MHAIPRTVQGGLTLIELVIVVSIVSTLLAIALPTMQTFVRNQRKTAEVNLLIGALNYTRSEAVLQRRSLRLCSGNSAEGCQDEPLWRGAGGNAFIRFKADGSAAGSNGTFTLCYQDKALHQVVVNFAGRMRSQEAPVNARCD